MTVSNTAHTLATTEQRAACAALRADLQAELAALPRSAKWHQRQPYTDAIGWLSSVVEHGAHGGVLGYTANPVVLRLAAQHGVRVQRPHLRG